MSKQPTTSTKLTKAQRDLLNRIIGGETFSRPFMSTVWYDGQSKRVNVKLTQRLAAMGLVDCESRNGRQYLVTR